MLVIVELDEDKVDKPNLRILEPYCNSHAVMTADMVIHISGAFVYILKDRHDTTPRVVSVRSFMSKQILPKEDNTCVDKVDGIVAKDVIKDETTELLKDTILSLTTKIDKGQTYYEVVAIDELNYILEPKEATDDIILSEQYDISVGSILVLARSVSLSTKPYVVAELSLSEGQILCLLRPITSKLDNIDGQLTDYTTTLDHYCVMVKTSSLVFKRVKIDYGLSVHTTRKVLTQRIYCDRCGKMEWVIVEGQLDDDETIIEGD